MSGESTNKDRKGDPGTGSGLSATGQIDSGQTSTITTDRWCSACARMGAAARALCPGSGAGHDHTRHNPPRHDRRRSWRGPVSEDLFFIQGAVTPQNTEASVQAPVLDVGVGGARLASPPLLAAHPAMKVGDRLSFQLDFYLPDDPGTEQHFTAHARVVAVTEASVSIAWPEIRSPLHPLSLLVDWLIAPVTSSTDEVDDQLWSALGAFLKGDEITLRPRKDRFLTDVARLRHMKDRGQLIVARDAQGHSVGTMSTLRFARTATMGHQIALLPAVRPCPLARALIMRSLYLTAFQRLARQAGPDAPEVISGYYTAAGTAWMADAHGAFVDEARKQAQEGINEHIWFWQINATRLAPPRPHPADLTVQRWADHDEETRRRWLPQLTSTLKSRGALFLQAQDLLQGEFTLDHPVGMSQDDASSWDNVRHREVFCASGSDGRLLAFLVADALDLAVNLSGLFDQARIYWCEPGQISEAVQGWCVEALLGEAASWYQAAPRAKELFGFIEDVPCADRWSEDQTWRRLPPPPERSRLARLRARSEAITWVGPGYLWAIRRDQIIPWLSHVEQRFRQMAGLSPPTPGEGQHEAGDQGVQAHHTDLRAS